MTRLENVYREKVVPVLQKEFAYSSPMQIPGIVKISLNIGLGSASQNNKLMEEAQAYGAPMDVVTDVQGARSAAKICTIIHGVIIAVFLVFVIIIPIIIALTEAGSGAFS